MYARKSLTNIRIERKMTKHSTNNKMRRKQELTPNQEKLTFTSVHLPCVFCQKINK